MANKRVDSLKAKQKKQKIIAALLGVVFLGVVAFEGPKVWKQLHPPASQATLSWNEKTGAIEPRPVVNWFDNGPTEQFIQFEVEGGPSGRRCFAATPNHTIYTPDGEVSAEELEIGDEVLVSVEDQLHRLVVALPGPGWWWSLL